MNSQLFDSDGCYPPKFADLLRDDLYPLVDEIVQRTVYFLEENNAPVSDYALISHVLLNILRLESNTEWVRKLAEKDKPEIDE